MMSICLVFIVHNPLVLKKSYNYFSIGNDSQYFDMEKTQAHINAFSNNCYLPANHILKDALDTFPKDFKCSFAISNQALDQFEQFRPDVLQSFQELFATNNVESLACTGYNSLASLYSEKEFLRQVKNYHSTILKLFGVQPKVFLNSEMIYSNEVSKIVSSLPYTGILTEGSENILGWRSQNFVYQPKNAFKLKLLFRNHFLSNALSFNFSNTFSPEYPITAEKFIHWISGYMDKGKVLNIVLDYETFGHYQSLDSGILPFLSSFITTVSAMSELEFSTPSVIIKKYDPVAKIDVPHPISWSGVERDLSAWMGNDLQKSSLESIYNLEPLINKKKNTQFLELWRLLQSADYFSFMDTRWSNRGYVPHDLNNFDSAEEAYIVFNNIVNDLLLKLH